MFNSIVFSLLLVAPLIVAEWEWNIYVQSPGGIDNESCWTDQTPCATINFALKGVEHDSTVIFVHPGTYGLDNGIETQLRGKSQVGIIGLSIPVNISCSPFTGLSFTMMENIILENLTFHGCGGLRYRDFNKQSFTFQVAVFMLFCKNIQINNVVIKSSNGTGLTMYNTVGNVSVWGSTLIDNGLKGQGSLNQSACGGGGMKIKFLALNTSDMHTESTYITNTNYTIGNSVFLSNNATSHYSCYLEHNSHGGGLSIILGGQASNNMFIIDSNVIEGNSADNGGGLYISAESEIIVSIRNTNISSNTAFTGLAISLINNGSHSDDNYYEISNSTFIENSPKCKINELSSSGTIFADGINLNFSGYSLIERNYASGLKAKHHTKISVSEKSFLNFEENNGVVGGAIALFDCSYVVVYSNTQLNFISNYVSDKGGAIYSGPCTFIGDNIIPVSQCFIQYYRPHIHPDEWEDVNFNFISNTYTSCIPHYDEYDYDYYVEYIVNYNAISAASLSLCWWPSLNSSLLTPDETASTLCWNNWYYSPYNCSSSVSEDFDSDYNLHYYDSCSEDDCWSNSFSTVMSTHMCIESVHYDTCEDGQAVPINSFQLSCYDCDSTSLVYGWLIFMFVQILPVTLLVLLIITLNINLTQGSASGYIFYCQLLSTSFPGLKTRYPAWLPLHVRETNPITFLPFSIWNLNFLTALPTCISYPSISEKISNGIPVFITCSMDQLGAISFWYLIAAYPMVLLILLYIWLMMNEKGFMCVVYITRPIHHLLARFWHMFDIEPSLIHSIASVYVLCFMQFTATSLKLLSFYINDDDEDVTFYYDHSLHYFGWPHSLAGLFGITILIIIVIVHVFFYPFKWFQRLLHKIKLHKQLLVALADVFTGPYKDGSDNSKDYRWFAGLYLLLRVVFISLYILNHFSFTPSIVVGLQLVLTLLICIGLNIFRPYKRNIHNFSESSLWLLLSITNALKLTPLEYLLVYVTIMYWPPIVVIPYCIFWLVKKIKKCCDYHKSRRTAINNLDENTLTDENLTSPYMLSDDDNDVEFADRLMNPDLYNEQHVGVLPLPSPPPPSRHESETLSLQIDASSSYGTTINSK